MIEIVTIGDELTSGCTVDTNSAFIAQSLYAMGFIVSQITTVGDGVGDIARVLQSPQEGTRFVVCTGGLGPTEDDRTAQAAAATFGRNIALDQEALDALINKYRKFNRRVSSVSKKQAMLPEGSQVIENPVGTACGFLIKEGQRSFIFFPGVPEEVRAMTRSFLVPHIKKTLGSGQIMRNRTLKVFGIVESAIQERLKDALPESPTVSLAYYPHYPEIQLKLNGRGQDAGSVEHEMDIFRDIIYEKIGEFIYADTDVALEEVVGSLLRERRETLAVAESCTGGLISHRITNISGSSHYLERSVVVYSNQAKAQLLKVPENVLEEYGAVSRPVADYMAAGIRQHAQTTYGLAVTGIAGPTGGTSAKPVGTVFVGIASAQKTTVAEFHFPGNRDKIKLISSQMALNLLRKRILE